jgi:subtilisin family serine protease
MHPIPRIIYLCLVGIVVLASVSLAHAVIGTAVPPATGPAGFLGYVPDAVVVEFEEGVFERFDAGQLPRGRTGIRRLDRLFSRYGAGRICRQFPGARTRLFRGRLLNLARWHKIHFRHKVDVEKVAAAFKELDGVIDAQPIGIHAVALTPNESSFPDQWHLDQINDHDIDGPEAWNFETGSDDIVVAVIDTGVRWFHKDLGGSNAVYFDTPGFDDTIDGLHGADGNMWTNDAEVNGTPGADDDGNGYIDDMIGWDFVNFSFSCWRSEGGSSWKPR